MTCARCPNPTPITVEQAGVELCRVCADLGAENSKPAEVSVSRDRGPAGVMPNRTAPPARPARSKR